MILQGSHYDLAVPRESIAEKYVCGEIVDEEHNVNGYEPEEEEGEEEPEVMLKTKTTEQKLNELEIKFTKLNKKYAKCLKDNKELKAEINKRNPDNNHSSDKDNDSTEDEDILLKYTSKGYKQTNPQNNAEAHLKCTVCKRTFIKERVFRKHMEDHNEDGDWTCGDFECNFQTNSSHA